ncbi:hypothetical protein [Intestinibacillus sp. Marseille-P6563]|uniref:hypothetical protein n=1 Tax=Intestinibacillus sp. Marseille-P6563 TaxID=2364792 RepID=UPI000F067B17|nr:hypothetical protein [Intestinibacillus sp. Marseille-P6563]
MTTKEKIADRKAKIQACDARIDVLEKKKAALQKEVDALQNAEIKNLMQSIDLPFEDICSFLQSLSETPPKAGQKEGESI